MTVWFKNGDSGKNWKMKAHYLLNEWRWNYDASGAHFEFKQADARGHLLTRQTEYIVTVGGWF